MGRWAQYDEDDYRLPEGMRRVGYDADTQTYTYRDADGSLWEGAPGARYGKLTQIEGPSPAQRTPPPLPPRPKDDPPRESSDQPPARRFINFGQVRHIEDPPVVRHEDWRMLAPFLLLRRSLTSKKKKRQSSYEKCDTNKEKEVKARMSRRSTI